MIIMKTNREHYSWSQHSLFLASKLSFYKRYVLGQTQKPNIQFDKGKELGKYLETGEIPHWVDDPLLETVGKLVPSLDIMEEEIYFNILEGHKDKKELTWNKPILMYTDSSKKDGSIFYEYKTGAVPWTQDRVDECEQLDFYAVGHYKKYGIIPKCNLYWIETIKTEEPNGNMVIKYTGHVEKFTRIFSDECIENMMIKIMTTLAAIETWDYIELELEDTFINRYIKLLEDSKEISQELNIMKLEVETQMESEGIEYAGTENGRFSITRRKSWLYSKELIELKIKYDKEIKENKKSEEKSGKATFTESESLRFKKLNN